MVEDLSDWWSLLHLPDSAVFHEFQMSTLDELELKAI